MSSSIRPSVLYSQNFLKDPRLVVSLLAKTEISSTDVVYEIGPGKGIVTEQLALRYKRVVAIEKDPHLAALLLQRLADRPNVTIHTADFLHYPLPRTPYKVFANIPFNITAAIVTKLTTANNPPEDAYLIMQREAAEMFLGKAHESLRTILLKPWFELEILHRFQRKDFSPAPRVDVVMLRLRKRGPPLVSHNDRQCFRDFVVYIFTARRPKLDATLKSIFSRNQLNHVKRVLHLDLAGTPTSLSLEQWLSLFAYFKTVANIEAIQTLAGSEQTLIRQQTKLQKTHRTRPTP